MSVMLMTPCVGSSPRVRGTLEAPRDSSRSQRFIPACAGNTAAVLRASLELAVHPRVCGEHPVDVARALRPGGSSPRVRGTLVIPRGQPFIYRFIPACAGNTKICVRPISGMAVHPRVCGEHWRQSHDCEIRYGSSPRVRGTPPDLVVFTAPRRFIPACAGNTSFPSGIAPRTAVHPRVCGEHCTVAVILFTLGGSSPRVRGTPALEPAAVPMWLVHPRVCGEHEYQDGELRGLTGSSPRVRGTPQRRRSRVETRRFIPACAGNTRGDIGENGAVTVHPRVCGEHASRRQAPAR